MLCFLVELIPDYMMIFLCLITFWFKVCCLHKQSCPNFLLIFICVEYLFPSLHFHSVCVLTSESSLLQTTVQLGLVFFGLVLFFVFCFVNLFSPSVSFDRRIQSTLKLLISMNSLLTFCSLFSGCFLVPLFLCFTPFLCDMLRFLSCYLLYIYYRFFLCGYHET